MAKNVSNFFGALASFLSGDGFDFQWTGLLDGFESTIKELPKIAERQVGPLEAAVGAELDSAKARFGVGLSDEFARQKKLQDDVRKGLDFTANVPEIKVPTIDVKAPKFDETLVGGLLSPRSRTW